MGLFFDLAILVLVIVFLVVSCRKGAVRSLIEFIGSLAAVVLAFVLSIFLADFLFNALFRDSMVRSVEHALQSAVGQETVQQITAAFDSLPGFISNAVNVGAVTPQISSALTVSTQKAAEAVIDLAAGPVIKMLMRVLLVIVLYLVLKIVVRLVAFTGDRIARLPVLNQLNGLCGAVLGLVKAALVVLVSVAVIRAVVPMMEEPRVFTQENIQQSYVFRYLYEHNPVYSLFEVHGETV